MLAGSMSIYDRPQFVRSFFRIYLYICVCVPACVRAYVCASVRAVHLSASSGS